MRILAITYYYNGSQAYNRVKILIIVVILIINIFTYLYIIILYYTMLKLFIDYVPATCTTFTRNKKGTFNSV